MSVEENRAVVRRETEEMWNHTGKPPRRRRGLHPKLRRPHA